MKRRIVRGGLWAAILLPLAGCSDFVAPPESDPNAVPSATADQLFVAHQVNLWFWHSGTGARFASNWMQQMGGVARQSADHEKYIVDEGNMNDMWDPVYQQGGLIDVRKAQGQARDDSRTLFLGILQVHEAFMMGMLASLFGDIPYSEAVDPEIREPVLDDQAAVYSAVQSLLDQAISNLQSGGGQSPGAADFNFGGDAARWIAVAHTLKARFHLHLVEVEGTSRYQQALAEAQQGISSAAGDWREIRSSSAVESNSWFVWEGRRAGDLRTNALLVNLMNGGTPADLSDDDPRAILYFRPGTGDFAGQIIGHVTGTEPGDPASDASWLNIPGTASWNAEIVTCTENQFIIAEAQSALGNAAAAIAAAKAALDCEEDEWSVDLSDQKAEFDGLSGQALFDQIMEQKFVGVLLNMEIWNDFKRTCAPFRSAEPSGRGNPPYIAGEIPGRFFYSENERQTNTNIPAASQQLSRNDNDPSPC